MEDGGSTQEQEICLSVGCYTFTITDSYGDGVTGSEWSCGLDGTPFSITDQNGNVLFIETDPAFGDCEVGGQEGSCSASYSTMIVVISPRHHQAHGGGGSSPKMLLCIYDVCCVIGS